MSKGIGVVVAKYVISPHGWETFVSARVVGREVGKVVGKEVGTGSIGGCVSTVGGDEVGGGMSVVTSWGSRKDGFKRAVAATATEMLDGSGDVSLAGRRA